MRWLERLIERWIMPEDSARDQRLRESEDAVRQAKEIRTQSEARLEHLQMEYDVRTQNIEPGSGGTEHHGHT